MDKPISERHQIARDLAEWFSANRWCQVFGGDVGLWKGKRACYGQLISKARILDGEVRVYSPEYILVKLRGPMSRGDWDGVFSSKADVIRFFEVFGTQDLEQAELAVPTKNRR